MSAEMKNFLTLAEKRFSVRKFKATSVEREKLMYIFDSVRLAPSACNRQPWKFIVVEDKNLLDEIVGTYNREWFKTAPACIVACGNHSESWHRPVDGKDACDIDVAIAVTHLTLAAAEQGLGTCWICNFDAPRCAEVLHLPENFEPVALIPIGYPDVESSPKIRKSLDEMLEWK